MFTVSYDGSPIYDPYLDLAIIDPKATVELSAAGSFDFSVDPSHPWYNNFVLMSAEHEVVVYDTDEEIFRGRITSIGKETDTIKPISCEGQLAYLNDTTVRPYGTYPDTPDKGQKPAWTTIAPGTKRDYAEWLISQHNLYTDGTKKFFIRQNDIPDSSITRSSTTQPTTRQELLDKVIDVLGYGFLSGYDRGKQARYIDFFTDGSRTSSQAIEFGSNLLKYSQTTSSRDTITCIIPTGTPSEGDSFGIEELPDGDSGIEVSKVGDRIFLNEGVRRFGIIELPAKYEVETPESLLESATSDIVSRALQIDSVEISAFDLHLVDPKIERIRVGEWVLISGKPYNFNAQMMCIKIEYDLKDPGNTVYTFGAEIQSLSTRNKSLVSKIRLQEESLINKMAPISAEAKAAARKADAAVISSGNQYATSTSSTIAPTIGWSTDQPDWSEGLFIWMRTITEYGDRSVVVGSPALLTGNAGSSSTLVRVSSSNGVTFNRDDTITVVFSAAIYYGSLLISTLPQLKNIYGDTTVITWYEKPESSDDFTQIPANDPRLGSGGFALTTVTTDINIQTVFRASVER